MRVLSFLVTAAIACSFTTAVRAQTTEPAAPTTTAPELETPRRPAPPPVLSWELNPPRPAPKPPRWYGWQTLVVDFTSISFFVLGVANKDADWLAVFGGMSFLLATPIVHWAHGNSLGFASLGLRVLSYLVVFGLSLAVAGAAVASDGRDTANGTIAFLLVLDCAALATPVVLDAALFAFEPRPADRRSARTRVVPWVDARNHGAGLRLAFAL